MLTMETVTPLVGVWIEMGLPGKGRAKYLVTPLVGVWIEIHATIAGGMFKKSLPSWECGLKLLGMDLTQTRF